MIDFLQQTPAHDVRATLLLAHGAGAPMDSDFMNALTAALVVEGIEVLRFEFPYMAGRRQGGSKRPPDRAPVLLQAFAAAREQAGGRRIFLGGKSMGGRMATLLACEQDCRGVVCFGYPFHPPGKADKVRTGHLHEVRAPILICQGERDPFGRREEVAGYDLPSTVTLHWLPDGNHDLVPRRASGVTAQDNLISAARAAAAFMG